MKINRRVDRIERIDRARKVEQTEKENEEGRQEHANNSFSDRMRQRNENCSHKKSEQSQENMQDRKVITDINMVKRQMEEEAGKIGKIGRLRTQLNNRVENEINISNGRTNQKQKEKKAQKGYEDSIKIAQELAKGLDR